MNKIGIVTIVDYKNYGNRLQNYALQEALKSLGFQVETVVNSPYRLEFSFREKLKNKVSLVKKSSKKDLTLKIIKRIKFEMKRKRNLELLNNKKKSFKDFTKKHILETSYEVFPNTLNTSLLADFDYFVVGSDQVWNPHFRKGSSFDFLTFTEKDKRIAYAPSFGIDEIPNNYMENYKAWISEIPSISIREEAGAKIIKSLTGRNVNVLVDPTLLLTKEKWLSISKPAANKPQNEYLLTYFLGEVSKETEKKIERIAANKRLEIINLANTKNIDQYTADPSEFLDYIKTATVFLTDSFHGVVFSILLNTPFVVFERKGKTPSMNSRIENLLTLFKLENRMYQNIANEEHLFYVDYSHVPEIIELERNKAYAFLKAALKVEES